MMFVEPLDFETQRGGEVFFIADHHVDEWGQFAVNSDRSFAATDRTPQRVAIIKIVRNDRAVFLRRFHRLARDSRCCFRQRTEDAAGVKPARAFVTEDLVPIDIAGLELRHGRVTAIGTTGSGTYAETAFGEVQSVAHRASDTIKLHPLHVRLVHAALINQVLNQAAHRVVCKGRNQRRFQAKTTLQSARDVVFTATFPNLKTARRLYAAIARIETQHHLAERNDVPATLLFVLYL